MKPPAAAPPAPLVVALSLAGLEGVFLIGYGILELVNTVGSRPAVGLTTAAFFAMYGGGLVLCAYALHRGSSWARSPVLLAQLIQLGVAWSFRGGDTVAVAAALLTVAVVTLIGLLHPQSIDHLADEE